jgi:cysteinyl-tRNA synthetase
MHEAVGTLDQWYEAIGDVEPGMLCADAVDALADDLNTPKAIAVMHQLRDEAAAGPAGAKACLKATAQMLGLLSETATEWTARRRERARVDQGRVHDLIAARAEARKRKDFAEADRIRDSLDAMGVALMDSKDTKTGELLTTWEVKR